MGRDGDWIHAGAAYPAADGDGDDWEDEWSDDDEWLDDEWLDDDAPAEPHWTASPGWAAGPAGTGPGYGKGWGHGSVSGFPVLAVAVVAVVAAIAGAAVGFFLVRGTPVARASAPASVPASALPSSGSGTGPQALPGLPGSASGNGQLRMLLTGRVLAVSGRSITIGGAGPSVTAAVTKAAKITGRAHAIAGVKVGDQVAAQLTGTPSHLTLTTLQDPTQ